jgi:hypothetical protein
MRTITNDYKDAQILNLGSEGEHGPYLVTQTGIAPSDPLAKTCMFVLRPDGNWVNFNAYACRGKPEAIDEIVFSSMAKIMETFGMLFGRARVLDRRRRGRGVRLRVGAAPAVGGVSVVHLLRGRGRRPYDGRPRAAARAWLSVLALIVTLVCRLVFGNEAFAAPSATALSMRTMFSWEVK